MGKALVREANKRGGKTEKVYQEKFTSFFFRLSRVSLYFLRANLNFYITADKFVESKKKVGIFYKTELISTVILFHTSLLTQPTGDLWTCTSISLLLRRCLFETGGEGGFFSEENQQYKN